MPLRVKIQAKEDSTDPTEIEAQIINSVINTRFDAAIDCGAVIRRVEERGGTLTAFAQDQASRVETWAREMFPSLNVSVRFEGEMP